jgi:hypothetical protein
MDNLLDNRWMLGGFIGDYFPLAGPRIVREGSVTGTSILLVIKPDQTTPLENFPVPWNSHQ